MSDLLAVPLKKPAEADVVKPLKNLVQSNYRNLEAEKSAGINDAINEFSTLRNGAIWKVFDKQENGLDINYRYYDQICALELKIPVQELQIPFKWKDAFDKGSIFGGRVSLTLTSISYEKTCVLFNIAALQSVVAGAQSRDTDDGLKLAAKLLQQSAGIYSHLKTLASATIQQEPTPDLSQDTLTALCSLMLAQAQEIFVFKAIKDNMKDLIVAKLCCQCEELYSEALRALQKDTIRTLWDKEWIPHVAGRQAGMHALTMLYHSLVSRSNKAVGEEISRLQRAVELFKIAQTRSGKANLFEEYLTRAQRNLTESKKDNDFIYNEIIPDVGTLAGPGKAQLAKLLPLGAPMSDNFKDLFSNLVPVALNLAQTACESRKTEIVNGEIHKLRESTKALNGLLSSLNLPAVIETTASGASLPPSLQEKAKTVHDKGGMKYLRSLIEQLPEMLKRNEEILDECDRMLNEERDSDNLLRNQFKDRWTRTPSEKLAGTFRSNSEKYRTVINNAVAADKVIREKFETHRRGLELLSLPADQIAKEVPCGVSSSDACNSSQADILRGLMETANTIKAERDVIESELKCVTVDLKDRFLTALAADGAINEAAISLPEIGKVLTPLQAQVQENITRQESLLQEVQTAHTALMAQFGSSTDSRDALLSQLAAAYDTFVELQGYLQEGEKFYNGLTEILVVFQSKISDFCFARKTEKDELMKDLTHESSRSAPMATPTIPTHHTTTNAPTSVPSTAPQAAASAPAPMQTAIPYPQQMQQVPVPTAGFTGYVPPPMPQGFNPYGTLPYPSGYVGMPMAVPMPQAYYGTYPGAYGAQQQQQQQPPQNPNPNQPYGW